MLRRYFLSSISAIALGASAGILTPRRALACGDCDTYVPRRQSETPRKHDNRKGRGTALDPITLLTAIGILDLATAAFRQFVGPYLDYLIQTSTYLFIPLMIQYNRELGKLGRLTQPASGTTGFEDYRPSERWFQRNRFSKAEIAAFGAALKTDRENWNKWQRELNARKRKLNRYNPGLRVLTPKAQAIIDRKLAARKRRIDAIIAELAREREKIKSLRARYDAIKRDLRDLARLIGNLRQQNWTRAQLKNVERRASRLHNTLREAERELQHAVDKSYMARRRLAEIAKMPINL